jgi:hypothetical protein
MKRAVLFGLSPRDRRTLIVGGVAVLTLLLASRGVPAWLAWVREHRAAATELADRLELARAAAKSGHLGPGVDSLSTLYRAARPALLDGDTPAQAGAALASYVADVADATGVGLGAVQLTIDSAVASEAISRVRVRADLTGDVRGVLDLLHALETSTEPLLAVRTLTITSAEPAAPADRAEMLRATLEVEGLGRRDPSPLMTSE